MGLRDKITGAIDTGKEFGKHLISEFITNKDMSKGILNYDKYQEYSKMLDSGLLEDKDIDAIQKKMQSEDVIDPFLYSQYIKRQQEKLPTQKESDKLINEDTYNFKKSLEDDSRDNFSKGDKYQRQVISKAIDELTAQYQMLSSKVYTSYEDSKDPNLWATWQKVKPEYEISIKNAAKTFSDLIAKGYTYQEAYSEMINKHKDDAARIVDIEKNVMSKALRREGGVKRRLSKANEEFSKDGLLAVPKGTLQLGKALVDAIAIPFEALSRGMERTKNYFGMYDVLEELNNLNIYKDGGKLISNRRTLKSRGYEMLDGLPEYGPEILGFRLGNKASSATKLDSLMSLAVRGGKIGKDITAANNVTKAGKFLSENLQDFLWMDIVAQPMLGRPMTTEDFYENWLFNIPINAGLAAITRTTKGLSNLIPESAIRDGRISKNILEMISDGGFTMEEISAAMLAEKRIAKKTSPITPEMIEGIEIEKTIDDIKDGNFKNKISQSVEISLLPADIKSKVEQAIEEAKQLNIKNSKGIMSSKQITIDAQYQKAIKTNGANLGLDAQTSVAKEIMDRANKIEKAIMASPSQLNRTKLMQSSLLNVYRSGLISAEDLRNIIEALPESTSSNFIKGLWLGDDTKVGKKWMDAIINLNKDENGKLMLQQMNDNFSEITKEVIKKIEQKGNLIIGKSSFGGFIYQGNGKRFDILTQQTKSIDEAFTKVGAGGEYNISKSRKEDFSIKVGQAYKTEYQNTQAYNKVIHGYNKVRGELESGIDNKVDVAEMFQLAKFNPAGFKTIYNKILDSFGIEVIETLEDDMKITRLFMKASKLKELGELFLNWKNSGFSVSQMSKKELNLFKLINIKDYINANKFAKQEGVEFKSHLESLYKEQDGKYYFDLEKFNIKPKDEIEINKISSEGGFNEVEIKASQIKAETAFNKAITETLDETLDVSNSIDKYLSEMKGSILYESIKNATISIMDMHKANELPPIAVKAYAKIIGGLAGDRSSRHFLSQMFIEAPLSTQREIILAFVARGIGKDPELSSIIFSTMKSQMDNLKGFSNYMGIRQALDSIDELTGKGFELPESYLLPVKNKVHNLLYMYLEKYSPANSRLAFNTKHMKLQKVKLYEELKTGKLDITSYDKTKISEVADIVTHEVLSHHNIKNEGIAKEIRRGLTGFINDLKFKIEEIKSPAIKKIRIDTNIISKGSRTVTGIGIDGDTAVISLGLLSQVHLIKMLSDAEGFFKHIKEHEAGHILQSLSDIKKSLSLEDGLKILRKQYEDIKKGLSDDSYGKETRLVDSEYYYYFPEDIDVVEKSLDSVVAKVNSIYNLMMDGRISKSSELAQELTDLYKLYEGDISNRKFLLKVRDFLAEGLAQVKLYGEIGLSKEAFEKIGTTIGYFEDLLSDIRNVFDDVGNKFTRKQIESSLGFKLPTTEELKPIKIIEPIRYNYKVGPIGHYFLGENIVKAAVDNATDSAAKQYRDMFDLLEKKAKQIKSNYTIDINQLGRVINTTTTGIGYTLAEALQSVSKYRLQIDVRKLYFSLDELKNLKTNNITKHVLNKAVANVLALNGEYNQAYTNAVSNMIAPKMRELIISSIGKNEGAFLDMFNRVLDTPKTLPQLKKIIVDGDMDSLMRNISTYIFNKDIEVDIKKLDDQLFHIGKQLNKLVLNEFPGYGEQELKELIRQEGGVSNIISRRMDRLDEVIRQESNIIERNPDYLRAGGDIVGNPARGLEINNALLLESLYRNEMFDNKKFTELFKGNKRVQLLISKYKDKSSTITSYAQYLKRVTLSEAYKQGAIKSPITIQFKVGDESRFVTLDSKADTPVKQILNNYLWVIQKGGDGKLVKASSDDFGSFNIMSSDELYQSQKFFDSVAGKYVLDKLGIDPVYTKKAVKVTDKVRSTPNRLGETVDTEGKLIEEGDIVRRKSIIEILDEVKGYYMKDTNLEKMPNTLKKWEMYGNIKKGNQTIINRIDSLLSGPDRSTEAYIDKTLSLEVRDAVSGDVLRDARVTGFRQRFNIKGIDSDGEEEVVGESIAYNFIRDNDSFIKAQENFIDDIMKNSEYDEKLFNDLSEAKAAGITPAKIDYMQNTMEIELAITKEGKKGIPVTEIKYGIARKTNNGFIIDKDSLKNTPMWYEDGLKQLEMEEISTKKLKSNFKGDVKKMIDGVLDSFKC